jgi:hypothetical protein
MKWFDVKEIKNQGKLTPEQIDYIRKPSLTIFAPFNIIARRHWDILLSYLFISLLSTILTDNTPIVFLVSIIALVLGLTFFSFFHGRRLAWNRNNWGSFEKFKKSEAEWMPFAVVFFIPIIVGCILAFLVIARLILL